MNKKCHEDLRYLKLLAKNFPTITSASTEIINLQAILNLPKGTEHYISDIHGEYESFTHIINNASGVIKRKIEDTFKNTISVKGKESLATLIYYPEEKLEKIKLQENNLDDWYKLTLYRLVELLKTISSKYTRSKVRKSLPKDFSYIIEELLHEQGNYENKEAYYNGIINTIIEIKLADKFIISICNVIQQLAIDRLHIVGDIYDRGPGAEIIMDKLMNFHSIDIEWGNHDILWMGAASGSYALVANALRIALKYGNLFTVEEGYGINLLPLATFSIETYKNDNCSNFIPLQTNGEINKIDISLIAKMHKAISIIQFKLEGAIIKKHPEFDMENRKLLHRINYDDKSIDIDGKIYKLTDVNFPTIDKNNPYALTEQEEILIRRLSHNFKISERLQKHVKFLYNNGG
ncbi:MAG: fructose-bisphosphatase class III, partial [Clostridiaceae bacterium]